MNNHNLYLAKSRTSRLQRFHFGIFTPNSNTDTQRNLTQDFRAQSCKGTIIHVVGEPLMNGYTLEFKRNYDCSTAADLQELVYLGTVDAKNIFTSTETEFRLENVPRSILEREAAGIPPPKGGQDVRAPIDGVVTRRCQEWTMEFLRRLVEKELIATEAVEIAKGQRDPPTFGIFGLKSVD